MPSLTPININIQEESHLTNPIVAEEGKTLDVKFMEDIYQNLSRIILENDEYGNPKYWQGRFFGTDGEHRAAEILKEFWDQEIAREGKIHPADLDQIQHPNFTHKVDVQSPEDYNIIINLEDEEINVPYTECFPIHARTESIKIHQAENAVVHMAPNWAYLLGSIASSKAMHANANYIGEYGSLNIGKTVNIESSRQPIAKAKYQGEDIEHIYLIELSKCKKMIFNYYISGDYTYRTVLNLLQSFTNIDAFLCADYNNDTHFMDPIISTLPGMMINGSLGDKIKHGIDEYGDGSVTADFYLKSYYNDSVVSYNVIGTIPGEVDDIVFIGAHYDAMWSQGTCDDSCSVSTVWGIAKYVAENFIDKDKQPYYTLKFAAWGGEEKGRYGSRDYIQRNKDNEIYKYCINIGPSGFKNSSGYTKADTVLHVKHSFKILPLGLKKLLKNIDYTTLSGGYGGINIMGENQGLIWQWIWQLDGGSFIEYTTEGVFSFEKGGFLLPISDWHHKDGQNHTKGDVIGNVDETDIGATAFVVLKTLLFLDEKGKKSVSEEKLNSEQSMSRQSHNS